MSHQDRVRWNQRYTDGFTASFVPHPLAVLALAMGPPDGPVAELACGPSGSALLAAGAGRRVAAVDISEVALALLEAEARRRGLGGLVRGVQADLSALWLPRRRFALVLATGFWDRAVFAVAAQAVAPGGLLAWEAFTLAALRLRPGMCRDWCLAPGEPQSLLPGDFGVIETPDVPDNERGTKARLLARRAVTASPATPGPAARHPAAAGG